MEVALLDSHSIKLKGKTATLVLDPSLKMPKTTADGVVLVNSKTFEGGKLEGVRLVMSGPGEYEIGGVKISAFGKKNEVSYEIRMDGLEILLARDDILQKAQDKTKEYHVVVLDSASGADQWIVTSHTPRVVLLYGEKAKEFSKALGNDTPESLSKYQTTLEKLPDEIEIFVLQ